MIPDYAVHVLSRYGVRVVEGQVGAYVHHGKVQRRSYLCAYMQKSLFEDIRPKLLRHGIDYISQCNGDGVRDMHMFPKKGTLWLVKKGNVGVTKLVELDEKLTKTDDSTLYVVLWKRSFPPIVPFQLPEWDVVTILLYVLQGKRVPRRIFATICLYFGKVFFCMI